MAATTKKPSTTRAIVAGRQKRQSGLPLGKEPAVAVSSKAPASSPATSKELAVARTDSREYRERYLDEVAPSGIVGRRIKFTKDGTFVTHDDGLEVSKDTVFYALCDQTAIGWIRFNGQGEKPDQVMGLLYEGFVMPPRESLGELDESQWELGLNGEPEDPQQHHMYLVLQAAETCEMFTYDTSSPTGRRAVGNLLRHYDRLVKLHPGHVPQVWLRPGGFQHKDPRVGFVPTPAFIPCGSRAADSTAKPDVSTKAILDDDIPDL